MCDGLYSHSIMCGRRIDIPFYRRKGRLKQRITALTLTGQEIHMGGSALQT